MTEKAKPNKLRVIFDKTLGADEIGNVIAGINEHLLTETDAKTVLRRVKGEDETYEVDLTKVKKHFNDLLKPFGDICGNYDMRFNREQYFVIKDQVAELEVRPVRESDYAPLL